MSDLQFLSGISSIVSRSTSFFRSPSSTKPAAGQRYSQEKPSKKTRTHPNETPASTGGSKRGDDAEERRGPWASLVVLSVDGGGVDGFAVQGLSSLLIILALMEKIAKEEKRREPSAKSSADSPMVEQKQQPSNSAVVASFFPHHYFDYIAGTSSGGLIAVMLGRLRMAINSAIDLYLKISPMIPQYSADPSSIYKIQLWNVTMKRIMIPSTRRKTKSHISGTKALESMEDIQKQKTFRSDATRCRTIICSLRRDRRRTALQPFLFRSYEHLSDAQGQAQDEIFDIGEVMRATSCSPSALKPVKLGDHKYYNAGFSSSNPSAEVLSEILQIESYQDDEGTPAHRPPVKNFLSIGCGNLTTGKRESSNDGSGTWNQKADMHPDPREKSGSDVHEAMKDFAAQFTDVMYHRFNVGNIEQTSTDMPGKLRDRITKVTYAYLNSPGIDELLSKCAEQLVDLRRRRCLTSRWEAFAFGTRYRCKYPGANCILKQEDAKVDRQELIDHLRIEHHVRKPVPAAGADKLDSNVPFEERFDNIQMLVERGRTDSD